MTPEQKKFDDIKHATDYKTVGDDIDYKVYIDDQAEEVVLLFKESDSRNDWKNNFLAFPWPLKLELSYSNNKTVWTTYGYAHAYESANTVPILELLQEASHHPEYKVCIRGWSFGSAMAKIATRHLEALGSEVDELTTYGDVKCWLNPFYKTKATTAREYTTPNDIVTYAVPFFCRDRKCKVGPALKIKELFNPDYWHTHYEEYDYSKYEEVNHDKGI